jgi:hypothetical protein
MSSACFATPLIFDIASMAMIPLIARLVWLLTLRLSAEVLRHRPFISHAHSVTRGKYLLITIEQS